MLRFYAVNSTTIKNATNMLVLPILFSGAIIDSVLLYILAKSRKRHEDKNVPPASLAEKRLGMCSSIFDVFFGKLKTSQEIAVHYCKWPAIVNHTADCVEIACKGTQKTTAVFCVGLVKNRDRVQRDISVFCFTFYISRFVY